MGANTFGSVFSVTTCGESHGPALGCIIDGCPPQIELDEDMVQKDLDRRRPGSTPYGTPRQEEDRVRIISGIFEGRTTGTPIGMVIENTSQRSRDYSDIKDIFRPSHADYTYLHKYGIRDYRGGGRASARETSMRVAAGAVARQVLRKLFGIEIDGCVTAIGPYGTQVYDPAQALSNPLNFADATMLEDLKGYIARLREQKDSCGAVVEVRAHHVPVGFGSPVFRRLDADLAGAMMGINAVKAVEIGDGFSMCARQGSEVRDEMAPEGFLANHSGGILGGISTGQTIRVRVGFKPTSSIQVPGRSIDTQGHAVEVSTKGRHDPCVGIRAVVIAEAMMALVLADAALMHKAQCFNVTDSSYLLKE